MSCPPAGSGGAAQPWADAPTGAHPCGAVFATGDWQAAWAQTTVESVLDQHVLPEIPLAGPVDATNLAAVTVPLRLLGDSPFWRGYEHDAGIPTVWQRPTAHLSSLYAISNPLNQLSAVDAVAVLGKALPRAVKWGAEALIVPNLERADLLSTVAAEQPPDAWVRLDVTCRLRLPGTFEDYLQGLSKSVRTELRRGHRRASERGVTAHVRSADDAVDRVPEFVSLTTASATKHDIPPLYDGTTLTAMLRTPGARLIFAERAGEMLAGILAFSNATSLVLWSGGIRYAALKEFHPYTFLLYEIIGSVTDAGLGWLDFGRGNLAFKQRRGFLPTDLWTAVYLLNPAEREQRRRDLSAMHRGIADLLGRTP